MNEAGKCAGDEDLAAEFLAEFADERRFREFAGLDFTAGKLPFQGEVLVSWALGDEHTAAGVLQDGTDDGEGRKRWHGGQTGGWGRGDEGMKGGFPSSVISLLVPRTPDSSKGGDGPIREGLSYVWHIPVVG